MALCATVHPRTRADSGHVLASSPQRRTTLAYEGHKCCRQATESRPSDHPRVRGLDAWRYCVPGRFPGSTFACGDGLTGPAGASRPASTANHRTRCVGEIADLIDAVSSGSPSRARGLTRLNSCRSWRGPAHHRARGIDIQPTRRSSSVWRTTLAHEDGNATSRHPRPRGVGDSCHPNHPLARDGTDSRTPSEIVGRTGSPSRTRV